MTELVRTNANSATASPERSLECAAGPRPNLWRALLNWLNPAGAVELLTETADLLIRGFFKDPGW